MNKFKIIYIISINIITFLAYGIDKYLAIKNKWRISEKTLLTLGFIGGSIGMILGMQLFRHKTKHTHFKVLSIIFLIIHIFIFKAK